MTFRNPLLAALVALALAMPAIVPGLDPQVHAQEGGASVVAAGLSNPRGLTWDANGALIVAEAGSGGEAAATGEAEVPPPAGPYTGGATASVSTIDAGCPVALATGLPSASSASGEVVGAAAVAYLGETLYALVSGGGAAHGNADQPNGVYVVDPAAGSASLLVDLGAWLRDNPVEAVPEADYDPEGSFFAMVAAPDGSALWVVESNSEQLLAVTPDGGVTRVADLSAGNMVPTALVAAPEGGVYVGHLTSAPFTAGSAEVILIDAAGEQSTVWNGLTTITGLAVGADGTLFASQLSTTRENPPFLEPGTGSIVRQTGADSSEPVATGLNFPASLATGPDGALYVSAPAIGANDGTGVVLRIDPAAGPLEVDIASLEVPDCGVAPAEATADSGQSSAGTSEVIVRIVNFEFDPAELTIPAGATVIWVNTDTTQHTVVAKRDGATIFDSGILEVGASFAFTFTEPGTYDYICGLHPNMTARVIVE